MHSAFTEEEVRFAAAQTHMARHVAAATGAEEARHGDAGDRQAPSQYQRPAPLPRLLGGKPVYEKRPDEMVRPAEPMKVHPVSSMQASMYANPTSGVAARVEQASPSRFVMPPTPDSVPIRLSTLLPEASAVTVTPPGLQLITLVCDAQRSQTFLGWLRKCETHDLHAICELLLPSAVALATHENGRLVVEEMLSLGNRLQRLQIADQLKGNIVRLAMDANGCWVVQKALQLLPVDVQIELAEELRSKVADCVESKHGNFVVQVCVEQMPPDSIDFIVKAVESRAQHFASHRFGCRVIQRLLEHCPVEQVSLILDQLVEASLELSISPYACHVVHCVLEHGRVDDKQKIFEVVRLNIVRLSRGRLSCSVVEKCMEIATVGLDAVYLQGHLHALFRVVLQDDIVEDMARKRFGRALLKRMLDYAPGPDRDLLEHKLTEARPSMMLTAI